MRHIVIGDIHGMDREFEELIEKLALEPEDEVIFVGDLVDKGPNSPGVVRAVRELAERNRVVLVEGNHENKHFRYRRHKVPRPHVAEEMAEKRPELVTITDALTPEDVEFLNNTVPFHKVEEHNLLVVHAGIPANRKFLPETVEEAMVPKNWRKEFGDLMRTRSVHHETGKMVPLGEEGPEDPFWAEVYCGRFGHVVFGHQPFMEGPREFAHGTGIDTGAVFGGYLTALVFNETGEREYVQVAGRKFANPFPIL